MPGIAGKVNLGFSGSERDYIPMKPVQRSAPPLPQRPRAQPPSLSHINRPLPRPPKNRTVVYVENANKIYGSGNNARHVLENLNMAVEEHSIYGLLGASGCGKTTILSCIVALRKLNTGTILICGQATGTPESGIPGKKVGYMPQEIAINGEFTIVEVLAYFGRIYGMKNSNIEDRTEYLQTLFHLHGLTERIQNLSDSQKRRVSMAVSLIHEPDLLILDEPTVGLDPLLRDSIWVYLHQLVAKSSTTIIVTTHYIEEMREVDRIGIMRSGHLLCEDSPMNLLQIYNENLLDSVVVKLCKQDERPTTPGVVGPFGQGQGVGEIIQPADPGADPRHGDVDGVCSQSRRRRDVQAEWHSGWGVEPATTRSKDRMRALLVKDFLVLIRNWLFSSIVIFMPAMAVSVFSIVLGSLPSHLKVGVVNYEIEECPSNGNWSALMAAGCSQPPNLSCVYLDLLNKKVVELLPFDTLEEAEEEALKLNLRGYVWFEANFSSRFFKRLVHKEPATNETLANSQINVRLDTADSEIGMFLRNTFQNAYNTLSGDLFTMCGIKTDERKSPIQYGDQIFQAASGDKNADLGYQTIGIAICYIFFFTALQCGLTYVIEKKDGMLHRTIVSGVERVEILLSHFFVHLVGVVMLQIIVSFVLVFVVFNVKPHGSLLLSFPLVLLSSITGISFGFLVATFCTEEKHTMLMSLGCIIPKMILTGIMWPLQDLPLALQYVGLAMPVTIPLVGIRSILFRGMGMRDEMVWLGFVTAVAWTAGTWLVIWLWNKFADRKG